MLLPDHFFKAPVGTYFLYSIFSKIKSIMFKINFHKTTKTYKNT